MADEIKVQVKLSLNKAGVGVDSSNGQVSTVVSVTQSGDGGATVSQTVSHTVDAAVALPASISAPYFLTVRNLDATNFVKLSNATGGSFAGGEFSEVPPGGAPILIKVPSGKTIYTLADTADCKIQFTAVNA